MNKRRRKKVEESEAKRFEETIWASPDGRQWEDLWLLHKIAHNCESNPRNSRYMIKIISRDLGREFQVETTRGLANEFKLKCFYKRFTLW